MNAKPAAPAPTSVWPTEWLRGALAVCVLHVIADGPTYGYAIANTPTESSFGTVKGGTLYPLLARLEEAGYVEVEWQAGDGGPGRKFYSLTPAGIEEHQRVVQAWLEFSSVTTTFLTGRTDSTGAPGPDTPTPTSREAQS